jgi:hypothetical protein
MHRDEGRQWMRRKQTMGVAEYIKLHARKTPMRMLMRPMQCTVFENSSPANGSN